MTDCASCGEEIGRGATFCPRCGQPVARAGRRGKGLDPVLWIVFGCGCALLAVAVGGILAALLIPNLLDAMNTGKQKRTLVDLRTLGVAIEEYRTDHEGQAPAAASMGELAAALAGYLDEVPATDHWKHPLRYECWSESSGTGPCDTYRLASPGRDGAFEHDRLQDYSGGAVPPYEWDRDLVFGDGVFVQYPGAPRPEAED